METNNITHSQALIDRIEMLTALKAVQKETITIKFKELKDSLNIGTIVKESVSQIASNSNTQKDLVKLATTSGVNYVINKFLGSNNSIKRYIGSLLAEKVSNSFIRNLFAKL